MGSVSQFAFGLCDDHYPVMSEIVYDLRIDCYSLRMLKRSGKWGKGFFEILNGGRFFFFQEVFI